MASWLVHSGYVYPIGGTIGDKYAYNAIIILVCVFQRLKFIFFINVYLFVPGQS